MRTLFISKQMFADFHFLISLADKLPSLIPLVELLPSNYSLASGSCMSGRRCFDNNDLSNL